MSDDLYTLVVALDNQGLAEGLVEKKNLFSQYKGNFMLMIITLSITKAESTP